jgi:hypothetical protein
MKVDEAFEGIERLWEELSVIVVLHSLAILLALISHLLPLAIFRPLDASHALPELQALRISLARFGADLPSVAGIVMIFYVILFQKISAFITRVPPFRLQYSAVALWRAGKYFDELRTLLHWLKDYSASPTLGDLQVAMDIVVAKNAVQYKEHYDAIVGVPMRGAAMWARYYSGFLLLALSALAFMWRSPGGWRISIAPLGLLLAAIFARCNWEAQIERLVKGRLEFAINSGTVQGLRESDQQNSNDNDPSLTETLESALRSFYNKSRPLALSYDDKSKFVYEVALINDLMQLPAPFLPYGNFWVIHLVRSAGLFSSAGAFPLITNVTFRRWLTEFPCWSSTSSELLSPYPSLAERFIYYVESDYALRLPITQATDGRIVRLLRRHRVVNIARLFGKFAMVDESRNYFVLPERREEFVRHELQRSPFKRWLRG